MKTFKDKTAVITGAASGIGYGIAEKCVDEGMNVVLADIEEGALTTAAKTLLDKGGNVIAQVTDVTKPEDLNTLQERTRKAFGDTHLLVNNAGVSGGARTWLTTLEMFKWVMDVNLYGVFHGIKSFVPGMIKHGGEGYVINTASVAGFMPVHPSMPYQVSKHAVVALTESLHYSFLVDKLNLKTAVLCPSWVDTKIGESHRNLPSDVRAAEPVFEPTAKDIERREAGRKVISSGSSPAEIAEIVFDGMRTQQLYILPHAEMNDIIQYRMDHILSDTPPDTTLGRSTK